MRAVPDFWDRRLVMADARRLCDRGNVELCVVDMPAAAFAPPPWFGHHQLFLSERVPMAARTFIILHELAHIVAGDAEEPTAVIMDDRRYPAEDQVADVVAGIGITTPADRALPTEGLTDLLRTLVPIESRAWQLYRSIEVAQLIREAPDLGRWSGR
jgi:hypothetical protein